MEASVGKIHLKIEDVESNLSFLNKITDENSKSIEVIFTLNIETRNKDLYIRRVN